MSVGGHDIVALIDSAHRVKPGDDLSLKIPLDKVHLFDPESTLALDKERQDGDTRVGGAARTGGAQARRGLRTQRHVRAASLASSEVAAGSPSRCRSCEGAAAVSSGPAESHPAASRRRRDAGARRRRPPSARELPGSGEWREALPQRRRRGRA